MNPMTSNALKACHCCGLVHRLPIAFENSVASPSYACTRCGARILHDENSTRARERTAAASLAALILFPAAILLPILQIEKLGHRYTSSILAGILELFSQGSWFLGLVILVFSIVLPLVKLLLLLELCWLRWLEHHHRAWAYRLIEFSGQIGRAHV